MCFLQQKSARVCFFSCIIVVVVVTSKEHWFDRTSAMGVGNVAKEVHTVMSAFKVSNKNSAALRKETKLRPLLENKTKWTGRILHQ